MALIIDLYKIKENNIEVGSIVLRQYKGQVAQHIELNIIPEYQNQGIMKKHLPIYLDSLKQKDFKTILALIEPHNLASQKLVEANGFKFLCFASCYKTYIKEI